jgi:hypothetical protein
MSRAPLALAVAMVRPFGEKIAIIEHPSMPLIFSPLSMSQT